MSQKCCYLIKLISCVFDGITVQFCGASAMTGIFAETDDIISALFGASELPLAKFSSCCADNAIN